MPASPMAATTAMSGQVLDVRVVLRGPTKLAVPAGASMRAVSEPVERGLRMLGAFQPGDDWLVVRELAERLALPRSTVSRMAFALARAGYLTYRESLRSFRLAPAVLNLGFSTSEHVEIIETARPILQRFADLNRLFVMLGARDGLDVTAMENWHAAGSAVTLAINADARFPISSYPIGLALLGALPVSERSYLLDKFGSRNGSAERMRLRSRVNESAAEIAGRGYCLSASEWAGQLPVAAAPVQFADRFPVVITCASAGKEYSLPQWREVIGPRLLKTVRLVKAAVDRIPGIEAA